MPNAQRYVIDDYMDSHKPPPILHRVLSLYRHLKGVCRSEREIGHSSHLTGTLPSVASQGTSPLFPKQTRSAMLSRDRQWPVEEESRAPSKDRPTITNWSNHLDQLSLASLTWFPSLESLGQAQAVAQGCGWHWLPPSCLRRRPEPALAVPRPRCSSRQWLAGLACGIKHRTRQD
ncbi:hypothetical protein N657DRAFT_32708 [Parathielavia appendiculata]|uniref:Uncharacterized protein n=1 Tax=Parathielavia appendiculata TaxID=2587402 RepID=A0AAN6U9J6_9PEZI|nr:hypothetical protein N657DRAFT_32708 [Parathielavia appendiculata]